MFSRIAYLPLLIGIALVASTLAIVIGAPSYPKYKQVRIPVQTSGGEFVCTFELFDRGQPNAVLIGCDNGGGGF